MPFIQFPGCRVGLVLFLLATLGGCWHSSSDNLREVVPPNFASDVVISSPTPNAATGATTTAITATVFLPDDFAEGPYPLILHSHGWGASRVSLADANALSTGGADHNSNYADQLDSLVPALRAAGFAVISYDQRGFGRADDGDDGSGDGSHGMSPNFEVEDAKAVIDWALANLDLVLDAPGDPRVGMVGGSYGGAFQLMAAAEDPRIDAIAPAVTWFNLGQALAPNGVLRKRWGLAICDFALRRGNSQLSIEIEQACNQVNEPSSREVGDIPATDNLFFRNGLSFYAGQAGFAMPLVDALIVHGNTDTLFNQNEADATFQFLSSAGGDVRMLIHDDGHGLPSGAGPSTDGTQSRPYCGSIDTVLATVDWLLEKLSGGPSTELPQVCLALNGSRAVHLDALPRGDSAHRVSISTAAVNAANNNDSTAAAQALFFPLPDLITGSGLVIAGIPVAHLTVNADATNSDPTPASGPNAAGVFIGIGIRRNGQTFLADNQLTPLLSSDSRTGLMPEAIELAGVAEGLQAGDQVGVLLYGKHGQFENQLGTAWGGNATVVSGTVDLPIFGPAEIDIRN